MTTSYIDIDAETALAQIGRGNVLAISGGRARREPRYHEDTIADALVLPVSNGYTVEVLLAANDTYTVRRVFKRGAKVWVKGEETEVYCDQVSDAAYRASCFVNVDFGEHRP